MASAGIGDASAEPDADPAPNPRGFLSHGAVLALPGCVLLFALAWWGIGRDAWFDEAFSVAATQQLTETYERTAYTMATYYAQLTLWTQPTLDLRWVRLLSVVHAVAAVVALGALASRCFGRRVAVWACLFAGASLMVVRYAHEARSFAFVILLVTVGWLATDHLVEEPSHRGWLACHVIVGLASPLTHGMAVFALAMQAVALLVAGAGRRVWYATAPGWALAVLTTGYLYRIGGSDLGTPPVDTDLTFVRAFLGGFHGGESFELAGIEPWHGVFAASIYGAVLCLVRLRSAPKGLDRFRAALAPAWGVGGIAVILVLNSVRPGVHVRYAVAAAPGLALLWALATEHVRTWLLARRQPLRLLGRAPLAALAVLVVLLAGQVEYHDGISNQWRSLVEKIADESELGDGVAVPGAHRAVFDVAWSRLDDPPELISVGTVQPLGTPLRFGSLSMGDTRWQVILSQRLWVVERRTGTRRETYQDFIDFYMTPVGFTELGRWDMGAYRLHLFENPQDVAALLEAAE